MREGYFENFRSGGVKSIREVNNVMVVYFVKKGVTSTCDLHA